MKASCARGDAASYRCDAAALAWSAPDSCCGCVTDAAEGCGGLGTAAPACTLRRSDGISGKLVLSVDRGS